jgi:hypothetical protein
MTASLGGNPRCGVEHVETACTWTQNGSNSGHLAACDSRLEIFSFKNVKLTFLDLIDPMTYGGLARRDFQTPFSGLTVGCGGGNSKFDSDRSPGLALAPQTCNRSSI